MAYSCCNVSCQRAATSRERMCDLVFDSSLGGAKTTGNVPVAQALETMQQKDLTATRRERQDRLLEQEQILAIRQSAIGLRFIGCQFLIIKRAVVIRAVGSCVTVAVYDYACGHAK